jgi:hypothetical protein
MPKTKFDNTLCQCGHPKGIHDPKCWGHGLLGGNCRKKCQKFVKEK